MNYDEEYFDEFVSELALGFGFDSEDEFQEYCDAMDEESIE